MRFFSPSRKTRPLRALGAVLCLSGLATSAALAQTMPTTAPAQAATAPVLQLRTLDLNREAALRVPISFEVRQRALRELLADLQQQSGMSLSARDETAIAAFKKRPKLCYCRDLRGSARPYFAATGRARCHRRANASAIVARAAWRGLAGTNRAVCQRSRIARDGRRGSDRDVARITNALAPSHRAARRRSIGAGLRQSRAPGSRSQ